VVKAYKKEEGKLMDVVKMSYHDGPSFFRWRRGMLWCVLEARVIVACADGTTAVARHA